jgi:hypothetical protein
MIKGYSTEGSWISLTELKDIERDDLGTTFNDYGLDPENLEAIWAVLDPRNAPQYLILTIGSETEEYLFSIDLSGATPVLEEEDGRILYVRKKGGEKDGCRV